MFSQHSVPKVSHQRDISAVGRFNFGLQAFHGFTWKSGCIQGRGAGDKGSFHEWWCWFPQPPPLLRAAWQPSVPARVPVCAHARLTCRSLGLTWAHKIRNHSPKQWGSPSNSPWEHGPANVGSSNFPCSVFQQPLCQAIRNKSCYTHSLVSFHTL